MRLWPSRVFGSAEQAIGAISRDHLASLAPLPQPGSDSVSHVTVLATALSDLIQQIKKGVAVEVGQPCEAILAACDGLVGCSVSDRGPYAQQEPLP